jgi:hypothetical protein
LMDGVSSGGVYPAAGVICAAHGAANDTAAIAMTSCPTDIHRRINCLLLF